MDSMADEAAETAEKEARRKKHRKRMNKILFRAWNLPDADPFQVTSHPSDIEVRDLTEVGKKMDKGVYEHGRSGWETFAKDMGLVYNWHINRKGKHVSIATNHLEEVVGYFAKIDPILGDLVVQSKPADTAERTSKKPNSSSDTKRKINSDELPAASPKKKANGVTNGSMTLSQREKRSLELLASYLEERGGERKQCEIFTCKVTQRTGGRFESIFFSAENKRFKSMADVARFLNLVKAPVKSQGVGINSSSRPKKVTDKRKLKRELDKLLKLKAKGAKALDDHNSENLVDHFPAGDGLMWEDGSRLSKAYKAGMVMPRSDIESFPGIPTHCIPDMLMVWDFLCTFCRTLSLEPIDLDDFASALSYRPMTELNCSNRVDDQQQLLPQSNIPIYLSECHIALLRLLVKDQTSDLWWWSVLETPEMVEQEDEYTSTRYKKRRATPAVVKIDMEALLSVEEDRSVTRKWLQALEDVRTRKPDVSGPIKSAVRSAIAVTTNQYVKVYLKKAMRSWTTKSAGLVKRAVVWLVDRIREARPDLWGRIVSHDEITEQKKLVASEAALEMDSIIEDADVDGVSDMNLDVDSDEESDFDEDEGSDNEDEYADQTDAPMSPSKKACSVTLNQNDETTTVTSFVPMKPVPSVTDLLLPPGKPVLQSDLIHSLTWPPLIGATSCRIFHWYKRRRNEVDDSMREFRQLQPMTVAERRRREMVASLRILSECGDPLDGNINHVESAIKHLCDGNEYLDLNPVQRLCILRILIEAAYDTHIVHSSIEDNFIARINAVKALDAEERRAKKAARDELAVIETAARERLAAEAKEAFIDKKRQELIEDIKDTQEYSVEFIESLNDDDIIDLDDDTRAEYEALPSPDSFNKSEVNAVVKIIQEETALGAEKLTILTLRDIEKKDESYLKSLQDELESLGRPDSRETSAKIDRVRQKIIKFTDQIQTLSEDRRSTIESLKDAIEDGTVKTLRNALKEAKLARLSGDDDENGGIWALDLIRDASLELKKLRAASVSLKAQKDLVAKRNKCFIRTEPLGRDRYQSSFIHFDYDKRSRIWSERDYILCDKDIGPSNDAVLFRSTQSASIGAPENFDDFVNPDDSDEPCRKSFLFFTRQEFHHTGELASLARHHWSCYTTDRSLRLLVKNLDGKCASEQALKEVLKETLENLALVAADAGSDAKHSNAISREDKGPYVVAPSAKEDFLSTGDEDAFFQEKQRSSNVDAEILQGIPSAIGRRVRLRKIPDPDRAPDDAEYWMATITGWKMENAHHCTSSHGVNIAESQSSIPIWRLGLDDGGELHLSASEVVEGIVRAIKWSTEYPGYVEHDAPFLSYRNNLGRFCGRAVEAPSSFTPQALAKQLIKKEQELYMPLKNRTYDNNWGGKAGARQAWVSSLKECGHMFDAVRDGLLTLENAFFELTGGFGAVEEKKDDNPTSQASANPLLRKDLLYNDNSRFDIELESLGHDVKGLWNSYDSRDIQRDLSKTVGILALGLDLICRNAQAYIDRTKSSVVQPTVTENTSLAYVGRRRAAMQPGGYTDFF
ncbi:LOW QUALITY PROTEIN: hypothetical protein ACHAXA_008458 [Cyclostephanos tholiformis]|uniref:DDT domain-containing protein n=1 Tax=Cyclostephanos tholiformis TaxID=382380 RepID=A0ABD3SBK3_9STRA